MRAYRWVSVTAGLLLLGIAVFGQRGRDGAEEESGDKPNTHLGYPQDWSSRHLLMPGARPEEVPAAGVRDPRHVYNLVMRQVAEAGTVAEGSCARLRIP